MRVVVRILGAEILAVEAGSAECDEEPQAGSATGQFEYGFSSPRPRWSPLHHSDDEDE